MKKLAAVILSLVTCYSFAKEAAGFQNNAGGWTVITTRDNYCASMNMSDGYAFGGDVYVRFCWIKRNNAILTVFESGENGIWPVEAFEVLDVEPLFKNNQL